MLRIDIKIKSCELFSEGAAKIIVRRQFVKREFDRISQSNINNLIDRCQIDVVY
ncbi:25615_t:CDS:2 [Gigaspora margarita]|uniref:25615_t:CDS:1 n=1 Tax=Gigaspora margarita TaxID=4874 RepID=A0ABM8W3S6_GIGMA|nr:25615_t:CDS:2 [Gigaspora margarita]